MTGGATVGSLLNVTTPVTHGGARKGAGRKSIFGSTAVAKPFAMDFTPTGRRQLAQLVRRTRLSRNAVLAVLALNHADALAAAFKERAADVAVVFPDKARDVLSIRVPKPAAVKLRAAQRRTGRGYSDIGEALVRWFGPSATFPAPLRAAGARRPRPATSPAPRPSGRP